MPGFEPRGRESKAAHDVGHHTDADSGTVLLRADHHPFHRSLFGGGDPAAQRDLRRSLSMKPDGRVLKKDARKSDTGDKQDSLGFHRNLLVVQPTGSQVRELSATACLHQARDSVWTIGGPQKRTV